MGVFIKFKSNRIVGDKLVGSVGIDLLRGAAMTQLTAAPGQISSPSLAAMML